MENYIIGIDLAKENDYTVIQKKNEKTGEYEVAEIIENK
jgi:hypothetical protein